MQKNAAWRRFGMLYPPQAGRRRVVRPRLSSWRSHPWLSPMAGPEPHRGCGSGPAMGDSLAGDRAAAVDCSKVCVCLTNQRGERSGRRGRGREGWNALKSTLHMHGEGWTDRQKNAGPPEQPRTEQMTHRRRLSADFSPGIAQPNGAVEHQLTGGRPDAVRAEIAFAFKLIRHRCGRVLQTRLDKSLANDQ